MSILMLLVSNRVMFLLIFQNIELEKLNFEILGIRGIEFRELGFGFLG